MDSVYFTIPEGEFSSELRIKGSRFIGVACHCSKEEEAEEILNRFRKKYYDATHVCYAFRISPQLYRYSDAGEPAGTAGLPIFQAIEHFQLFEILLMVIRYFGGTKLGIGGLVRAYSETARKTLEHIPLVEKVLYRRILVNLPYHLMNTLLSYLSRYEGKPEQLQYTEEISGAILVPAHRVENFLQDLTEASGAQIRYQQEENEFSQNK